MATKRLDNKKLKDLQPARELWTMCRPERAEYRFRAGRLGVRNAATTHRGDYVLPATRYLSLEKIHALF